jgi:hypothetical protein
MDATQFDRCMQSRGWALFEGIVPLDLVARMKADVRVKQSECRAWMEKAGLAADTAGAAHHILGGGTSLDEFLARLFLDAEISRWFGGPYILNSFGASVNRRGNERASYLSRMHRDLRTHSAGYRLMLNMLVMLDEFAPDNGATYVLSGSHRVAEPPGEKAFFERAERLVGPAGSIVLFDSNLWHAAGVNRTDGERAALTLTFSRPFFKQQMDYPRFLGPEYMARVPERVRQVLGYYARTPSSYEEWYRPREQRLYRADQG